MTIEYLVCLISNYMPMMLYMYLCHLYSNSTLGFWLSLVLLSVRVCEDMCW